MFIRRLSKSPRTRGIPLACAAVVALVVGLMTANGRTSPAHAQTASLVEITSFGSNPGNLRMFKYVPTGLPANAPLVVVLHGCGQTASLYGAASGWMQQADTFGFALVVPEQRSANNPLSCFNWFEPGDTSRGSGEALSIRQMVDNVEASHSIDPTRVFVSGLSAGGAMSSNMLAAYPDVFAGGGVVAGVPARCAKFSFESFLCMNPGANLSPQQWGDRARAAFPAWSGPWPKVSIWHGTADPTVNVMNATESLEQWTNVHGTDQTVDEQETVEGYPHRTYHDPSGQPVVETWLLANQPHGEPLDPGPAADQCGTAGTIAMVDMNICASFHMVQFFGLDEGGGPGDPGTATFASKPEDGYVKANADGSGAQVGANEELLGLGIGRGADGKFNRSILSFDTSSIPDDAEITSAHITVQRNSGGGDPWASPAGNELVIDVATGCFGTGCPTGADDWAAAPTVANVAKLEPWSSGSTTSTAFNQAGLDAINPTGTTQLKLRFTQFQQLMAYVIVGHESAAQLIVEYELP